MNTYNVTIPKSLAKMGDLMLIPRKEYESLLVLRKFKEYTPTALERKKLRKAELNFKKGKTLSFNEFSNKLGFTN